MLLRACGFLWALWWNVVGALRRLVAHEVGCAWRWCVPGRRVRVELPCGQALGAIEEGVLMLKGVPYAEDIIGDRRFQAPVRRRRWDGVRDCTAWGPCAPQVVNVLNGGRSNVMNGLALVRRMVRLVVGHKMLGRRFVHEGSEEGCLAVNIWCPVERKGGAPVVVFAHGGGYLVGSGGPPLVSGTPFAAQGIVFVAMNYRLGVLGGLRVPGADQNRSLRDVACAVEWVRDNIASVGGDPDNITLCGESAGGMATAALLASDLLASGTNEALMKRAVCMSGAAHTVLPARRADEVYAAFIKHLPPSVAAELAAAPGGAAAEILGSVPLDDLLAAQSKTQREHDKSFRAHNNGWLLIFAPHVDGDVLPDHPLPLLADGRGVARRGVHLVTGTCAHEFSLFARPLYGTRDINSELARHLQLWLGAVGAHCDEGTAALAAHYATSHYAESFYGRRQHRHVLAAGTDWVFRIPSERLAEAFCRGGGAVRVYRYDWAVPTHPHLGAAHATELPLLFGTYRSMPFFGTCRGTANAALCMQSTWAALARGEVTAEDWPLFDTTTRPVQALCGGDGALTHTLWDPHRESLKMWDGITPTEHFRAWGAHK